MHQAARYHAFKTLAQTALTNVLATTEEIPFTEFGFAEIYLPSTAPQVSVSLWACPRQASEPDPTTPANQPQPAQNYYQVCDASGNPILMTLSPGRCYALPVQNRAMGSLKLVLNGATSQTVEISMMS